MSGHAKGYCAALAVVLSVLALTVALLFKIIWIFYVFFIAAAILATGLVALLAYLMASGQ